MVMRLISRPILAFKPENLGHLLYGYNFSASLNEVSIHQVGQCLCFAHALVCGQALGCVTYVTCDLGFELPYGAYLP